MREDGVLSFDGAILLALRVPGHLNTPIGPPELKMVALDLTALGGWTVLTLVIFLVAGYPAVLGERRPALLAMIGTSSGALLSETLKTLFTRPRPELVVHFVPVSSYSYPSGHAMNAAIVYLTLAAIALPAAPSRVARAYLVTAALLLVVAIGLTRLYLGVHWPTDVLAGWAAGTGWTYFWAQLLKVWLNRLTGITLVLASHRARGRRRTERDATSTTDRVLLPPNIVDLTIAAWAL